MKYAQQPIQDLKMASSLSTSGLTSIKTEFLKREKKCMHDKAFFFI